MSIQKISLETLKKVRRYIQHTLTVPEAAQAERWTALDQDSEPPEPESLEDLSGIFTFGGRSKEDLSDANSHRGWIISTVNPADALLKLPGLSLKPALRLVSYLYRANGDGIGLVFAVPESFSTMDNLAKSLKGCYDIAHPPKPDKALPQFMDAIEGNQTPISFAIASVFRRELQEFGAVGKRCRWSHHHLLEALPPQSSCQWRVNPPPKDFSIKVGVLPNGQAVVEFFTYRTGNPIVVYRHLDQYPIQRYHPNSMNKAVALIHIPYH